MQVSTNAWGNCLGKCQQKLPDGSSRFPVNALNDCNCSPQHEHQHLVIYWSTRIIASLWLFCGQMLSGILHWLSLGHLVLITRKWEIWFLCRRCWHYLLSDESGDQKISPNAGACCNARISAMMTELCDKEHGLWDCVSLDHWAGHHPGPESHPGPETCNYWTLRMVLTSNLRSETFRSSWSLFVHNSQLERGTTEPNA